ncbi:MAG: sugar phosphate isomerase/epimerase [Cryobacterium sp.]|nr:sugar phosphate isomerase/epimerase [Cryobacterium sp.]
MKYAVFTTTTPEWSPEEAAQKLAAQGWDGIEWGINDFPPAEVPSFRAGNRAVWPFTGLEDNLDRIAQITRDAGLEYSSIGGYALAHQREKVEQLLAATARLGARQVRIGAPHVRSADYHTLMQLTRDDYAWVAERAAHHGVKALVETHHRLLSASASACMDILDGLDPRHVGVIHDIGNMVVEGREDYLSAFQMLGDYLAHVHVKNVKWLADAPDADGGVRHREAWAPLRTGVASMQEYFEALRKVGYAGWITVEDFTEELPVEERAADNLAYLKAVEARVAAIPEEELCVDPSDYMLGQLRR